MPNYKKVIAAVIQKDNKYLLAQRKQQDSLYGKWEFPGGKVEGNESDHECLIRELHEEFRIHASVGSYLISSYFEHNEQLYEMRAYLVLSFDGTFELHDHMAIQWVEPQNLTLYDVPEPDKPIIEILLRDNIQKS